MADSQCKKPEPPCLCNLTEDVLEKILSLLPLEDVAKLASEGRVFNRVYRKLPYVEFCHSVGIPDDKIDDEKYMVVSANRLWEQYDNAVSGVLNNHSGNLRKLVIRLPVYLRQFGSATVVDTAVERWFGRARVLGVSDFVFDGSSTDLPPIIFRWETLVNLELTSVSFPRFDPELRVMLPNLSSLRLEHFTLSRGCDLGTFLRACPNLTYLLMRGIMALNPSTYITINCPLLETLDISVVRRRCTIIFENVSSLTELRVYSQDIDQFRFLGHPISEAPVQVASNLHTLIIQVQTNVNGTISLVQCFPSLRRLELLLITSRQDCQFVNVHGLESVQTIIIRGYHGEHEQKLVVQYLLAHSPRLREFTLFVHRYSNFMVKRNQNFLSDIRRMITELPRLSQEAELEFAWIEGDDEIRYVSQPNYICLLGSVSFVLVIFVYEVHICSLYLRFRVLVFA